MPGQYPVNLSEDGSRFGRSLSDGVFLEVRAVSTALRSLGRGGQIYLVRIVAAHPRYTKVSNKGESKTISKKAGVVVALSSLQNPKDLDDHRVFYSTENFLTFLANNCSIWIRSG